MRGGGKWLLGATALSACIAMLAPAGAMAADANAVPPKLSLNPGGEQQGMLGAEDDYLAYFSTRDLDPESEYTVGSTVSFVCLVDGQSAPCEAEHFPARLVTAGPAISCPRRKAKRRRRPCRPRPIVEPATEQTEAKGPFIGRVPVPAGLAGGPHTVTVIATDEDGTDPSPPSVTVTLDLQPPTAPRIVEGPPKVGRDPKPRFRFRSLDDHGFPADSYTTFSARLKRLRPRGPSWRTGNPFGSYLSMKDPHCPLPTRCTGVAWPVYEASGPGGTSFGIAERLHPGLYRFQVLARDVVGNESATTVRRFRILAS